MRAYAEPIGVVGIIASNVVVLSIRSFARSQGLKVGWWSGSSAPDREHLRMLAQSEDLALAQRSRLYLQAVQPDVADGRRFGSPLNGEIVMRVGCSK